MRITALLEAQYAAMLAWPVNADCAPMLTMLPVPLASIDGAAQVTILNTAPAFSAIRWSYCCNASAASDEPMLNPPAMLHSTSI